MNDVLFRVYLLENYTTKEMEDDISGPDMELLQNFWDLMQEHKLNQLAAAVNRGFVGK